MMSNDGNKEFKFDGFSINRRGVFEQVGEEKPGGDSHSP